MYVIKGINKEFQTRRQAKQFKRARRIKNREIEFIEKNKKRISISVIL